MFLSDYDENASEFDMEGTGPKCIVSECNFRCHPKQTRYKVYPFPEAHEIKVKWFKKLKIMFLRESEGVYEFGSKRVMVKVERDKI